MLKFTVFVENEDGYEVQEEVEFPSKKEVCDDCEGYGKVLNASMRNHAYSAEEFAESFDEEDAHEYFRRGGKYDVVCPTCKGKNVVDVVDESAFSVEHKALWKQIQKQEEEEAMFDRICDMERMMGA